MAETNYTVQQHDRYYVNCVTFEVERVLFKVPREGFEQRGKIFRSMFSLPVEGDGVQVTPDNKPIVLNHVRKEDFESLLEAMYTFGKGMRELSSEGWIGVLKLSTMWEFSDLRKLAILQLSRPGMNLSMSAKIILGKTYKVKSWLLEGYKFLVTLNSVEMEDFGEIDWETRAKLLFLRDFGSCFHCGGTAWVKSSAPSITGGKKKRKGKKLDLLECAPPQQVEAASSLKKPGVTLHQVFAHEFEGMSDE